MWQTCKELKDATYVSEMVVLNPNEFICVATNNSKGRSKLLKYNVNQDKWQQMLVIEGELQVPSLCLNRNINMLYSYVNGKLSFCDLNVKHKKFITHKTQLNVYNQSCLIANSDLHLVGGYTNRDHLIWDSVEREFVSKYTFAVTDWQRCIEGAAFVHIPSRNMLLLMGGYDAGIVECLDVIWKYCLKDAKWEKVGKLPVKMQRFGHIVTSDERYMIIFGGTNVQQCVRKITDAFAIYIISLDTFLIRESKVRCPNIAHLNQSNFLAVLMCNTKKHAMLVSGFIRHCWSNPNFHNLMYLSEDLIKLIQTWHAFDVVHLLSVDSGKHWRINVPDIFNINLDK